ncbi:hypothetical protein NXS19_002949 [Fusarium pseudograminearum]|nr:hypothetical protein NXS19_002949 [Fusarium pseudograminearum]
MTFPNNQKINFKVFQNTINNKTSPTAQTLSIQEDVDCAVDAAQTAYPLWRKLSQDERAEYLVKFADAIEAHKQEFIDLLGREAGKPPQAGAFELMLVMEHVSKTPELRLKEEKPEDNDDRTAIVRYVPLGVGVGIVPWNFPMILGIGKAYPAMLAGNTFIWKPSLYAPYSALKLAEIGAKVLPPGVFQALSGGDDLGPMLTAHPGVAKVSFTGSTETGKKIMASCASTLKRVTVAGKVAFLEYVHSGQICMNIKRIYCGGFSDPEAFFGPIQNKMQFDKLQRLYGEIDKQGWKSLTSTNGAAKPEKGYHIQPTLIDNPPEDSEIVQTEPFGPIVPMMKWSDEDDVVARANASNLGLGASVWSKDVPRARRMAEQLEAGSIWVNTHFEVAPNVPFGGHKSSGIGMDWGEVGLKGWCNPQAYWVKHSGV